VLLIDQDALRNRSSGGTDVVVAYRGGVAQIGRWDATQEAFIAEEPPSRVQARNTGGVLTIMLHQSEIENASIFSVAVAAAHVGPNGLYAALTPRRISNSGGTGSSTDRQRLPPGR
jgi:hypothetical protein